MNSFPGVCIMIPTYNQASFISKAIESALAQDYPNIEIVIADDCSTDNTGEIVQPYLIHGKIKYIKNSANIGRVANYRKCLYEYTNADWVINLDGDDYYTNRHFISEAMEAIQLGGIEEVLYYQGVHVIQTGNKQKILYPNIKGSNETITAATYFLQYFDRNYFSHMSTLYNRQTAIDHDFYHFDIISADIYSFLCLCLQVQNKKVIVSKVISGVWLQHHHNVSQTINLPTHWKNFQLYLKLYHQSRKNGKWWLYSTIWLAKAGYNYSKSYFSGIFRSLQHKIAKG